MPDNMIKKHNQYISHDKYPSPSNRSSSPGRVPTNDFQSHFNRMDTSLNQTELQPSNLQQYRKRLKQLQTYLSKQKQKRQQSQNKLFAFQKRSLQRENEFHKILYNLDNTLATYSNKNTDIDKIYQQINLKFIESRKSQKELLQTRYKQNLGIMERKINQIIETMKVQLDKNSKLSQEENSTLVKYMDKIQSYALDIDLNNNQLIVKNQDLEFKLNLCREEKNLLIMELNEKKMLLKKYYQIANTNKRNTGMSSMSYKRNNSVCLSQKNSSKSKVNQIDLISKLKPSTAAIGNRTSIHQNLTINITQTTPQLSNKLTNQYKDIDLMKINTFNNNPTKNTKKIGKRQYISLNSTLQLRNIGEMIYENSKEYLKNGGNNDNERMNSLKEMQFSMDLNKKLTKGNKNNSEFNQMNCYTKNIQKSTEQLKNPKLQKNSNPNTSKQNTISALNRILTRQKRKKIEYHSSLALLQQKILSIDKIVINSLLKLKQINNNKNIENSQHLISSQRKWFKDILQRIKNIINDFDYSLSMKNNLNMNVNVQNIGGKQLINMKKNKFMVVDNKINNNSVQNQQDNQNNDRVKSSQIKKNKVNRKVNAEELLELVS